MHNQATNTHGVSLVKYRDGITLSYTLDSETNITEDFGSLESALSIFGSKSFEEITGFQLIEYSNERNEDE